MYRMNLFPNDRVSSVRSITIFIMDPSFQEMQKLGIFPLHLLFEYKIIFILILHCCCWHECDAKGFKDLNRFTKN